MEIPEEARKEVAKGFFVGDTVILKEETEETKAQGIKLGAVGVVSKDDNAETLKGWKVVDYEKSFKKAIDQMEPEKINELFDRLVSIGKIKAPDTGEENIENNENDGNNS